MIRIESSWNDRPTPSQVRAVSKMCAILKIKEPLEERMSTRAEARSLLYQLRGQLRALPRKGKKEKNGISSMV